MKKLLLAVILTGTMVVNAEDASVAAPAEQKTAPVAQANKVEQAPMMRPKRGPLTEEQRAEMRARREKMMAERKAEMEKKSVEIIKKYGLDEEKAKALFAELMESMRPVRRPRPGVKPSAAKPVPVPKPDAAPKAE